MADRVFIKRLLAVIGILGVVALLIFTSIKIISLLVILFAAWITAETFDISIRFMMKRKLPRWLAVTITTLIVLLLVTLMIIIVVPLVTQELANLIGLIKNAPALITQMTLNYQAFRQTSLLAETILPPAPDGLPQAILDQGGVNALITRLEGALPLLTDIGAYIGAMLAKIILYLFLTVLIMIEPEIYYTTLIELMPARYEERAREIVTMVRKNVKSWSGAMLLSITITSLLYAIVLGLILRLPGALALSVIAGVATIIPTVGNTLAIIPVIIVAAPFGITKLILAVVLYVVVGAVQDRIVTPAIMRTELSIPVALLIFFQLTLATLIGPIGLVLAVPLLAILITLVREIYVYDVLGKRPVPEAKPEEKVTQPQADAEE